MTNESLLKSCKPYADRGFEHASENDAVAYFGDGLCLGYMFGVIEQLRYLCQSSEYAVRDFPGGAENKIRLDTIAKVAEVYATSATGHNVNAVIQAFLNHAQANPGNWEYNPAAEDWLAPLFPCIE